MADSEIAGLTEDTTPDATDNVYAQDSAGNTDKRVPLSALTTITTTATTVNAAGAVMESDYDANTILAATSDNTPVALTVAEQTLVGRITAGAIDDLSATAVRTLLNVENGATADQSAAEILAAILTVDGAASGLDADLLDGQSSAYYATASSITDHTGDTSAAHAASAISADSTTLVGTGTDVQAVLEELDNGVADHLADTSAAHAASAVSADSTTLVGTGTDVQAVLEELDNSVAAALPKVAAGASVEDIGAVESNVQTVAATGATETLDTAVYGVFDMTMDQACTFTLSNPAPSGKATIFTLILRGAFTPTFPASVDWGDAAAPTYTTPSQYVFTTVDSGTIWLGQQVAKAFG